MVSIFILVIGICLGSFVNAFVWRLHEQQHERDAKKPNKERLTDLSISKGRSMCPACGHTLAAKDLIPVVSWLLLKGKCRYCSSPISWQYPLVEVLGGLVFISSYIWWPYAFTNLGVALFVVWGISLVFMLALAVYDARWYLLPTKLIVPLGVLGGVFAALHIWYEGFNTMRLLELVGAVLILWGLFRIIYAISPKLIGFGDVRLAIPLALFAGTPLAVFVLLFTASLIGTLSVLPLLIQGKKTLKQALPFGPFLLLGCYIAVLFADSLINWLNSTVFYI